MKVSYETLAEDSTAFIYPSSRKFYPQEIEELRNEIEQFLETTFSEFSYFFKIIENRFIAIFIDSEKSLPIELLDKIASFIMYLEDKYKITLLDKINICFKQGKYIQYQDMKKFRTLLKNKSISKNTIVFNNLVQNKFDFENHFETPLSESWLSHLVK